jgi:hypothetical protein
MSSDLTWTERMNPRRWGEKAPVTRAERRRAARRRPPHDPRFTTRKPKTEALRRLLYMVHARRAAT